MEEGLPMKEKAGGAPEEKGVRHQWAIYRDLQ